MAKLDLAWVDQITLTRAGGAVQRCHGLRHAGGYSNAEHQWGVAMLLLHLFPSDFKRLVSFALVHDVPECLVGDIPSTAKESASVNPLEDAILEEFGLPQLSLLGPRERLVLKACDRLELYLWACEQLASGNRYAQEVKSNLDETFANDQQIGSLPGPAAELWMYLHQCSVVPDKTGLLRKIKEAHGITE